MPDASLLHHQRLLKRSPPASSALLANLRRSLRQQGWTARKLAEHFSIGEATAKRWLVGRGLTLDRLERLCELCNLSLAELARAAEQPQHALAKELTLAQERELSSDVFLSFLFMTILGGTTPEEIARDFLVPPPVMALLLARLERLALIDRLPGGRVRPLVDRTIIWRKSPMRTLFEQHMKPQFLAMDFAADETMFVSELVKLSPRGAAELAELLERLRRDVQALAARDRETALLPGQWHGMLAVMRELDLSELRTG